MCAAQANDGDVQRQDCPTCDRDFKKIGMHWAQSDCPFPDLTQHQYEITVGLLMGDGCIRDRSVRPSLDVTGAESDYLEYLSQEFGILTSVVRLQRTAEELARMNRESGLDPDADASTYSDQYVLRFRANPAFEEHRDWYASGEKVFPTDIELTPTVLKHWYVCDGHFHKDGYIQIGAANEYEHRSKLNTYFEQVGFGAPRWTAYEQKMTEGAIGANLTFTVNESERLFEYMGDPLPGFEHKWPDPSR